MGRNDSRTDSDDEVERSEEMSLHPREVPAAHDPTPPTIRASARLSSKVGTVTTSGSRSRTGGDSSRRDDSGGGCSDLGLGLDSDSNVGGHDSHAGRRIPTVRR